MITFIKGGITININNLYEGQIIKNYKELCTKLEIKQQTNGRARQKQLKELELYCNYSKEGNKYIINKIYETPTITLNDLLKTKNSKCIKLLANNIVEYLYNNPDELQQIPLIKLFTVLGITNNNYKYANNYRKELSQLYNIQLASIYYFYDNTKNEFKRIIERCLNNLQNRSVLFWSKCIMIVDSKNEIIYKADEETKKLILDTQKEILQYLNVNNMHEVMRDNEKRKQFNNAIKKELSFNYYFAYDIVIGEKALKIEYNNIQENKKKLNNLIIDKSNKLFDKDIYKPFKDEYDKLIELLININNKDNIQNSLLSKYEENQEKYIEDTIIEEYKHIERIEIIKDTYIDTFK